MLERSVNRIASDYQILSKGRKERFTKLNARSSEGRISLISPACSAWRVVQSLQTDNISGVTVNQQRNNSLAVRFRAFRVLHKTSVKEEDHASLGLHYTCESDT